MIESLDRRLVAVMFTDMVGYTALMQTDERLALEKRNRYVRALESHHAACGGTIVQRLGDGSMSMFPSSLSAVQAGVAMQRELSAEDVWVRIGVHVGEVIVEAERLTGEAVNIAARIESFAVPRGVMLSDSADDPIKNRTDVGVVPLGRFRLKNVGRPFELYAVAAEGIVVPDPGTLEGKGERASLPSNLPEPTAPLAAETKTVSLSWPDALSRMTRYGSWSRTTRFPMPISRRATAMSSNFRCRSIPSRRTCRLPCLADGLMPEVLNWRATPSKSTTFPGAPALTKSCAIEPMTRTTVRSSARARVTGVKQQFKVGWRRQR